MSEVQVVALAIGDPAGISAELTARLLADEVAREAVMLVLGDRRVLEMGARHAGIDLDLPTVAASELGEAKPDRSCLIDLGNCDAAELQLGVARAAGGRSALMNFRLSLKAAQAGFADLVLFTPFNKHAMRLGEPDYVDEIGFINRTLGIARSGSEFNVLDEVWNARVTSHIPLSQVASGLDAERVFQSLRLTVQTMEGAGYTRPRIGVAALNPHAGDGGLFGTEDDQIILPAVERARSMQMAVTGPVPSDTVFMRAVKGEFDAVLTMFHDQGQIAMKLIGFDRGVTLIAGYPFPIVTPAHGTAYDIAGKGAANPNATRKALQLGLKLAARGANDGSSSAGGRPSFAALAEQVRRASMAA